MAIEHHEAICVAAISISGLFATRVAVLIAPLYAQATSGCKDAVAEPLSMNERIIQGETPVTADLSQ